MTATALPVILVDGSSYLYRAFYAVDLKDAKGRPTGAMRGVMSMLQSLQKTYPQSQIVVVFDAKGKNFRHDLSADYKANRKAMPEELACQVEPLYQMIRALGLPLLSIAGVEADDVIGTLAQAASALVPVIIATGDKDMAQLVNAHVSLLDTMKNTLSTPVEVLEKFGVTPAQMVDFLALMGDSADNIKGVEKCGAKTAAKWLQKYTTLENVLANSGEIGGKIGENLKKAADYLPISQQLATIKTDVALEQNLSELINQPANHAALAELYREYNFNSWLKALDAAPATPAAPSAPEDIGSTDYYVAPNTLAPEFTLIQSRAALEDLGQKIEMYQQLAINVVAEDALLGVAISWEHGKAAYIPCDAGLFNAVARDFDLPAASAILAPIFANAEIGKVCFDAKTQWQMAAQNHWQLAGVCADVALAGYVLHSQADNDLPSLARRYLNLDIQSREDIQGRGAKAQPLAALPTEELAQCAMAEAAATLRLNQLLAAVLAQNPAMEQLYKQVELPTALALAKIEARGVLLDCEFLQQQSQDLAVQLHQLEQSAHQVAGRRFNLNSPLQLRQILFEEQKLEVVAKTPKGQPSTSEEVLQKLAEDGALLPELLLSHRSLAKLKSTYTDKLPLLVDADSRIHTHYNQSVTLTGRLSSSEPNLQNIPARSQEGRQIRAAFVAKKNHVLIAADYSQIELRIMAHLSGDAMLLQAFADGVDVHSATAAEVFGVPISQVSAAQRRAAKAVNFGLIYGMSAFGLAKNLKVSRQEAQAYVDKYFERYQQVGEYMHQSRELAKTQGYVETIFGRRLYLPDINAKNAAKRAHAERTAINAPMQGSAADIIKMAMIDIERTFGENPAIDLIMQVHDELVFEVADNQVQMAVATIRDLMNNAATLKVPLQVDIGSGANWDSAH